LPLKTWVKKLALVFGAQGSMTLVKMSEPTPLTTSPTKQQNPKLPKFYNSKLDDSPRLLRVWTAL